MTPNGTHLDRLMTELGLENYQLANLVGTGRQTIWKLRTGLTRMLPHWAQRLAPHLGVSWQELVEGPPTPTDQERAEWNAIFDALDDEQRRALMFVASGMARRDDPDDQPTPLPRHLPEPVPAQPVRRVGSGRKGT